MTQDLDAMFGVCKGEQDSNALRAFMAALRLHSGHWHWVQDANTAKWWVIDDTDGDCEHLAWELAYERLAEKPRVAFLSRKLTRLPVPSWTFFKVPLESQHLFHWIDTQFRTLEPQDSAQAATSDTSWSGSMILLTRWPNMARYGRQLELTLACSKMLTDWVSYDDLVASGVPSQQLNAVLLDARQSGILKHMRHEGGTASPGQPHGNMAASSSSDHGRFGLIKRILHRFSLK